MKLGEEKLGLGVGLAVTMVCAWATTNWVPGLASSLTTLVGGLTGLYALFVGSHVTNAYLSSKPKEAPKPENLAEGEGG